MIKGAIRSAMLADGVEVIVADGGSVDATVQMAQDCGASVIKSSPGRALQMNAAAVDARGSVLLFLHADTRLPKRFDRTVRKILQDRGVAGGAFRLSIDSRCVSFRLIETVANLRSCLLQMPYGDQAIFMRIETFRQLGGFSDLPVMEDYELVRRLRRLGSIVVSHHTVKTSARRWLHQGIWVTTLVHQLMILAYRLGFSTKRIAAWRRIDPDVIRSCAE